MKTNNILSLPFALVLLAVLTACGSVPPLLPAQKVQLSGNGDDLKTSNMKIFLIEGENRNISSALQFNFRDIVADTVNASGSEVLDRELAQKIFGEIDFSSMNSEGSDEYTGPESANFLMISTLKRSTAYGNYVSRSSWTDKKGKTHVTPAYCKYSGNVSGKVEIRKLPSMKRVNIVDISGSASFQDVNGNRSCNKRGMISGITDSALQQTLRKGNEQYKMITQHVGANAYVTGARKHDGKIYLETNLGRMLGAKKKIKVNIYQLIEGEIVEVATANFLDNNNIYAERAFLKIDQDDFPRIKRGMIVKLSGDGGGFFEDMKDKVNKLVN